MTATFVVEDGTGVAGANSLASVAAADQYHENHGNPAAWSGATEADKQNALREATEYYVAKWATRLKGVKVSATQDLPHPRAGATDEDGAVIASNIVPTATVNVVSYLALQKINGDTLLADVDAPTGGVDREKIKVGPIELDTAYAGGTSSTAKQYTKANALMRPYLKSSSSVTRA